MPEPSVSLPEGRTAPRPLLEGTRLAATRCSQVVGVLLLACFASGDARADDLLDVYYRALDRDPTFQAARYDNRIAKADFTWLTLGAAVNCDVRKRL